MSEAIAQRAAALAERAERPAPESWRPDDRTKGHPEKLVGELVRYEDNQTSYGPCRIAVLRDPAGAEWSVWLLGTVLRNEFERLRPRPGELVYVRFDGRRQAKNPGGSAYDAWTVVVDRDDAVWESSRDEGGFADRPAGAPAEASLRCEQCGHTAPVHAAGCPRGDDSVPF